jgi:hypothetical protein
MEHKSSEKWFFESFKDYVEKMPYLYGPVMERIIAYGNDNPLMLSANQYLDNLDMFASDPSIGYQPEGATVANLALYRNGYASMCCAYYLYICRERKGFGACVSQFDRGLVISGMLSEIGGFAGLVPGMEVFQGDDLSKKHIGVYAGTYDFGRGHEPAVYQSLSSTPASICVRYPKNDKCCLGPNLTSMSTKWIYWGWPKFVIRS